MKDGTRTELETIVDKIQRDDFSSIELRALFMILRNVGVEFPALYDIVSFVAHEDERDRGVTYEYIKHFVDQFAHVTVNGGNLTMRIPLHSQTDVIRELYAVLETNKVACLNHGLFTGRAYHIMCETLKIIAGTKINYSNHSVARCWLSEVEQHKNGLGVSFVFEPINAPDNRMKARQVHILAFYAQMNLNDLTQKAGDLTITV